MIFILTLERLLNGPSYNKPVPRHNVSPEQIDGEELETKSSADSIVIEQQRNPEVKTIYVNPEPSRANSVNELYQLETKEKTRRSIIILMALLMRCLMLILEEYFTYFFKTSFANFHLNKVFMPLFTFEVIEMYFFEPPVVRFGSWSTLLLLRFNPQHTQSVMLTFSTILRLLQDVVVYFVTFISFDFVISVILEGR